MMNRAGGGRRRAWITGAVVLVAGGAIAAALAVRGPAGGANKGNGKDKPPVALDFTPAEVTQPVRAALPLVVEFSGPLVAPRTAVVKAKAAGTLLALRVGEGSRVKAGQSLGDIDLADLQSRASDRQALVEQAEANLLEAERQHKANVGLAGQNFISPTALQTSQARLDAARAQLKSAQAQLVSTRVGLRDAALTTPISGIVGKRHVVPGEKVSAEQPVMTVVDLSTLELVGSVGTHEVSRLKPGLPVTVRVEGEAGTVAGRIDRISPQAEAGTRAIGVVVALDNAGERFRAGQYAQARAEVADAEPRLTVPLGALGQASGQDFVWTIENGALVRRIVVTGRRDVAHDRVEVLKGLAPEATLLAMRFDNLKEGVPARTVAARAASAPAGATPVASAGASAPAATAPAARPAASAASPVGGAAPVARAG